MTPWYSALVKPPLTPPDTLFGPVWTLLYALMATAAFLVWREGRVQKKKRDVRRALIAFAVQLGLNLVWSPFFFGLQDPQLALIDILALLTAIVWTIILFRRVSIVAAWLLVPYLLWVSFATYLNTAIWWLNR